MKKKIFIVMLICLLAIGALVGCTTGAEKDIVVISRESGSGTRSAFEEILAIPADQVFSSIEFNQTNNVLTEVKINKRAIGYISLGSLNNDVKALNINGVAASADNVLNSSYAIARPFELVYNKGNGLSALAQDFANFVKSKESIEIINKKGYVAISEGLDYTSANLSGELKISGSTSVEPLFQSIFAAYNKLNPNVTLSLSANGSGTGIADAKAGKVDFGMSSREIKDSELESVNILNLCKDGIAVIVNKENTLDNITLENLAKIYKGEIKKFSALA